MPEATEVKSMFGAIAGRYDLLNRILSLGTDRRWRRRSCVEMAAAPGDVAVDLCCGTGDLARELGKRGATVMAADFSREMLSRARAKGVPRLTEADCLRLPYRDGAFDLVTVAFGARNLADLPAGLREMRRVLRPGGRLGILEFAAPRGAIFGRLYHLYLRLAVPLIGALVSGRRSAYAYLSTSIQEFPDQDRMKRIIEQAGFESVRHLDFARGIAALYVADKAAADCPSIR